MQIIDGKKIAKQLLEEISIKASALNFKPVLCDILIGTDPVSDSFVRIKAKIAESCGITFKRIDLPESADLKAIGAEIEKIKTLANLRGLIFQLPLPISLPKEQVLDLLPENLDVDCISQINSNKFYSGNAVFIPPTAAAILTILDSLNLNLKEKNILVIGSGALVGKPVAYLLKKRGLTVTVAGKKTPDLTSVTKIADVIILGAGSASLLNSSMCKNEAVIIDAGTSESEGSVVGDADFKSFSNTNCKITPVPGGVGPVTVAKLLDNVLLACKQTF